MELKKGTSLLGGKYRIERTLGQGSFGITYLAKTKLTAEGALGSMTIEAQVAIKEFFMSDVNSRRNGGTAVEGSTGSVFTNYRNKFKKEAQNLASLSHPNIVKVLDVFDENNTTYYVMEFIEGENLDDYIKRKGHLSEKEAIAITKEIGSALSYMHSRNMLHLDIKPKNIMRNSDGVCRLIDFGLSKQFSDNGEPESSTTIGLGTPGYAPLEQASHKQSCTFPATLDVYALGATVYKMLTGKRPPEAAAIIEDGFPREELEALGISKRMISATEKAMAPFRKNRHQTIAAFLAALTDNEETTTITIATEEITTITPTITEIASTLESQLELEELERLTYEELIRQEQEEQERRTWEASGSVNGYDYIDLGLSVKWAICNVGASSLSDYGDYFAWGETSTKSTYTKKNCLTYKKNIGNISGNPQYDVARDKWGGSWRLPTQAEFKELVDQCSWKWTIQGGHYGYKVTGKNGKSIFLPAAGQRYGTSPDFVGAYGYYWSSVPYENNTDRAYGLNFDSSFHLVYRIDRYCGFSVRPVVE